MHLLQGDLNFTSNLLPLLYDGAAAATRGRAHGVTRIVFLQGASSTAAACREHRLAAASAFYIFSVFNGNLPPQLGVNAQVVARKRAASEKKGHATIHVVHQVDVPPSSPLNSMLKSAHASQRNVYMKQVLHICMQKHVDVLACSLQSIEKANIAHYAHDHQNTHSGYVRTQSRGSRSNYFTDTKKHFLQKNTF